MQNSECSSDLSRMPRHEEVKAWIEIWKKIVDVQQHFNDIELRIRNYALIVVGALLALGGYALKESVAIQLLGAELSAASVIVFAAVIPLLSFYFMDRFWYHRLLDGSVNAGIEVEKKLQALGYDIKLGQEISKASPFVWRLWGEKIDVDACWCKLPSRKMRSKHKMDFFYLALTAALLAVSFALINVGLPAKM